ncbi:hypothetical protein F5J12DRAFT_349740 [Pisolithus orientalis]|uniref:uncharacterized protein n=1 Tax=Pisolithus orientalis TaxID=936130 RepID=UPI00222575D9|nr:uncharacterized protein F5J12DRAFT_349740 [Pisolithus orientalis]KAI5980778.1 hypothetical protein F5J12DRAFT_349740 [Pisolithus orientalis]
MASSPHMSTTTRRLRASLAGDLEIIQMTNDQSIFAWGWSRSGGLANSFLAKDPSDFHGCSSVIRMDLSDFIAALEKHLSKKQLRKLVSLEEQFQTFTVTNHGIQIWLPLKRQSCCGGSEFLAAILTCCDAREKSSPITITIERFGPNRFRYFGQLPVVENQPLSIEFKSILLPYRDNINPNIRGPSCRQRMLPRILLEDITPSDNIIVVLGAANSGKSNFMKMLTGARPEPGADLLSFCTTTICAFASVRNGKRFVFLDTPPLDSDCFEAALMQFGLL